MAAATISWRVGAAGAGSAGAGAGGSADVGGDAAGAGDSAGAGAAAGATASSAWRFAAGESSARWPLARFRAVDIWFDLEIELIQWLLVYTGSV